MDVYAATKRELRNGTLGAIRAAVESEPLLEGVFFGPPRQLSADHEPPLLAPAGEGSDRTGPSTGFGGRSSVTGHMITRCHREVCALAPARCHHASIVCAGPEQ